MLALAGKWLKSNKSSAHSVMHVRLVCAIRSMCDPPNAPYQCFETPKQQWCSPLATPHPTDHAETAAPHLLWLQNGSKVTSGVLHIV